MLRFGSFGKRGIIKYFNNTQTHKVRLFQMLEQSVSLKLGYNFKLLIDSGSQTATVHNWNCRPRIKAARYEYVKWLPPPTDWIKINSDGFLEGSSAGYAAVVRDNNAEQIGLSHASFPPTYSFD